MGLTNHHRYQYWQAATDDRFYGKMPLCSLPHNKLSSKRFPAITMMIATVYTCLFIFAPGEMIDRLCFLPLGDFTLLHLIRVTVTGTLFHVGIGHFLINFVFLWVFGIFMEPRLTPGQYISAVLLGSVLSRLISLNLLVSQVSTSSFDMLWCPPTGASGAVAGLMGCFLMSYRWGRQSGRERIACQVFVPSWVPIGAMLLIVSFLARDLVGFSAAMFDPSGTAIFWGHTGGLLGGLVLGIVSTLQNDNYDQKREDVAKRLGNGLKRGVYDQCHLELIIS